MENESPWRVALVGNPNSGKSALFNALTGSTQRVGNWPGVTVDKKQGRMTLRDHSGDLVDLPGVYALPASMNSSASVDQQIAIRFLLHESIDVLINVVDACHLERHLYLTTQLMELGVPMVLAVNMMDRVPAQMQLDLPALESRLGIPVVGVVATTASGVDNLQCTIQRQLQAKPSAALVQWPMDIKQAVQPLLHVLHQYNDFSARSIVMRIQEQDPTLADGLDSTLYEQLQSLYRQQKSNIEALDWDLLWADARYTVVQQVVTACVHVRADQPKVSAWSDRIDRLMLHRFWGLPLFLLVMYCQFFFAVNIAGAFQDFFDISSTALLVHGMTQLLTSWHAPNVLIAIVAQGCGKGINTTITFIPVLWGMFFFLSFLEDCGYMARAAFVMDRIMMALGLPGQSFIPMIVGFGCNVPAVMGARTLSRQQDRILTVLMMPFMSCGARLAIFAVFVSAFFPSGGQNVIFCLYVIGILVAIATAMLVRHHVLSGEPEPLVMELPAYHWPKMSVLLRYSTRRLKTFLKRAGKVIVPTCMLLGALNAYTPSGHLVSQAALSQVNNHHIAQSHAEDQNSILSIVGQFITPVFEPMGIQAQNWPATMGLFSGVLAKEVVIGTLNTLYSQQAQLASPASPPAVGQELRDAFDSIPHNLLNLRHAWKNPVVASEADVTMNHTALGMMSQRFGSQAAAWSYLLFILLYFPCISTMAAIDREIGRSWAWFSVLWSTALAYGVAVMSFQLATLTQHPLSSLGISMLCLAVFVLIGFYLLRSIARHHSLEKAT